MPEKLVIVTLNRSVTFQGQVFSGQCEMPEKLAKLASKRGFVVEKKAMNSLLKGKSKATQDGSLPEDFPFKDELVSQDVKTLAMIGELGEKGLVELKDIGPARATEIFVAYEKAIS